MVRVPLLCNALKAFVMTDHVANNLSAELASLSTRSAVHVNVSHNALRLDRAVNCSQQAEEIPMGVQEQDQ
eukprot:8459951-Alexandrium_andersonii.AAC.1